jgi:hypothetical protein
MTTSDDSVETTSAPPHRARSNTLTPGAPTSIAPVPGVLRAAAIASLGLARSMPPQRAPIASPAPLPWRSR